MKLSATAREAPTTADLNAEAQPPLGESAKPPAAPGVHSSSAAGRAQGLALPFGKGRVVVLGEAAMLSAQVATFPRAGQQVTTKFGMNVPGYDDRQFALNVLHWLSGLLK